MVRTLKDSVGIQSSSVCFMVIENVWHAGTQWMCFFVFVEDR